MVQESGETGDTGSVDRRIVGGLRVVSRSQVLVEMAAGWCSRTDGRGDGRNSRTLSVSGTGSRLAGQGDDDKRQDAGPAIEID